MADRPPFAARIASRATSPSNCGTALKCVKHPMTPIITLQAFFPGNHAHSPFPRLSYCYIGYDGGDCCDCDQELSTCIDPDACRVETAASTCDDEASGDGTCDSSNNSDECGEFCVGNENRYLSILHMGISSYSQQRISSRVVNSPQRISFSNKDPVTCPCLVIGSPFPYVCLWWCSTLSIFTCGCK